VSLPEAQQKAHDVDAFKLGETDKCRTGKVRAGSTQGLKDKKHTKKRKKKKNKNTRPDLDEHLFLGGKLKVKSRKGIAARRGGGAGKNATN